jgi:TPR repeat protein
MAYDADGWGAPDEDGRMPSERRRPHHAPHRPPSLAALAEREQALEAWDLAQGDRALSLEERKRRDRRAHDIAEDRRAREAQQAQLKSSERDRQLMNALDQRGREDKRREREAEENRRKDAQRQQAQDQHHKEEEQALMAWAWMIIDNAGEDLTHSQAEATRHGMTPVLAKAITDAEEIRQQRAAQRRRNEQAALEREREEEEAKQQLEKEALEALNYMFERGHFSGEDELDVAEMLRTESVRSRPLSFAKDTIEHYKVIRKAVGILQKNRDAGRYSEEELAGASVLLTPADHRMVLTYELALKIVRSQEQMEKQMKTHATLVEYSYDLPRIERATRHKKLFGAPPRPQPAAPKSHGQAPAASLPVEAKAKPNAPPVCKKRSIADAVRAKAAQLRGRFPEATSAQRVMAESQRAVALNKSGREATTLMQEAAQHDGEARFLMGLWHKLGDNGLTPDVAQAIQWYEVGALLNEDPRCQYNLAVIYREDPEFKDVHLYLHWLQMAANDEGGHKPSKTAQFRLGEAYEDGLEGGLAQDVGLARLWYGKSATLGNQDAILALKRL